jgi:hypothetical protein
VSAYLPPVRYQPVIEQSSQEELEAIRKLRDLFVQMATTVAEHEGHAYRAVHAKGHALLRGNLEINPGLSDELAHGLFSKPGSYPVLARLSSPPAEQLPDSVSTPRAIALKILGVRGDRVDDSSTTGSQDLLMVNGPRFTAPDPAGFLHSARILAATTERMPRTKKMISSALRGTEALLEALGGESDKLKGMGGEPQRHPLGEIYFTQVPFRYGPYMAKFSLAPLSDVLLDLHDQPLPSGEDAQRDAVASLLQSLPMPLEWVLRVQLCRDLRSMPIEDASVEWSEEVSPWQPVARLTVPGQPSWTAESQALEDKLSFSPWNALTDHRPLGGVNRARREIMAASRDFRSGFNRCPIQEPGSDKL